jgi:excisionase family DNA binding protein
MQTFSTAEVAEMAGVSAEAIKKRVLRGQLRAVKRSGHWRIPLAELERAGIRVAPPADTTALVAELSATIDKQAAELAALRALPERVEAERARAEDLERERDQARAELNEIAAWRERLAAASWWSRRRLLREFHQQPHGAR